MSGCSLHTGQLFLIVFYSLLNTREDFGLDLAERTVPYACLTWRSRGLAPGSPVRGHAFGKSKTSGQNKT